MLTLHNSFVCHHSKSLRNLPRSRCAFLNLRTEADVLLAVSAYHNTAFNGCQLVCRPRNIQDKPNWTPTSAPKFQFEARYFILKSLTRDDLEIATARGWWATQAKNEAILDKAFKSTRDVYLIFSANKSGEFYGYARCVSSPLCSLFDKYATLGTPFKIKWITIQPLPFSRVKYLRNAWNANKPIKVSRDGIEVETSIGKRLLQEFDSERHR
ncbi:YT521-B-like domain-containing protein, partial [Gaertneriomyces semiglobifer]